MKFIAVLICLYSDAGLRYTWVWFTLSADPATEDALLRPGRGRVLRLAVDPKNEDTLRSEMMGDDHMMT